MPVLNGFETIERMRKLSFIDFSRMKVIAFSAITEQQFRGNEKANMFDGFMEKPISLERVKLLLRGS